MSKYNNKRTFYDGQWFDSELEKNYYVYYKQLERSGQIRNLRRQVKFVLQEKFEDSGEKFSEIAYKADFVFEEAPEWKQVASDPKGVRTAVFNLKYKMFRKRYPHIELRIEK